MPEVHGLLPILGSTDVAATVGFLTTRLGFAGNWTTEDKGRVIYASVSLDGKGLLIQEIETPSIWPQASFWIGDADDYRTEIVERGAMPTETVDRSFGMREFTVVVPGGVALNFGSRRTP